MPLAGPVRLPGMRAGAVKPRAPWRWHWGRLAGLLIRCGVWALALRWSTFFGIALSFWVYAQLRAGYSEPLPSPTDGERAEQEEAGHGFLFTQDPDTPNHWKVTHRE